MSQLTSSFDFIELDRRFRKLDKESKREDIALASYTDEVFGLGLLRDGLTWTELLDERLTVILGEAGSGKTWELRHRAAALADDGKFGFFIPLEGLASRSISEVLDQKKYQEFQSWKKGRDDAVFFLDSVDEAKFHRISDFLSALDQFRDAIGDALKRAQIFLSCRISEWRPETDVSEVLRRFRQPKTVRQKSDESTGAIEVANANDLLLVVQIQPLDRERVQRFAEARGINDVERFIKALDDRYVWEFVRRPLDVVDLINYWEEKKKLGTLTELLEFSVERKLRVPERDGSDPLSPSRAREGAEALATASILCRQLNFRVPDAAAVTDEALDGRSCLAEDWRSDECRALLMRPIFDAASYGRIRFHHRRVGEYLAAKWICNRMQDGCPANELKEILFEKVDSKLVLRPALAPVAAWLCAGTDRWNDDARNWIAEVAPMIHLRYGDPENLPREYKREILRAIVRATKGRNRVWIESSRDSLSRLADPDLASDLSAIIDDPTNSQDVRAEMLQTVRYGKLAACLSSALALIRSPDESDTLKTYAAAAIRDAGDNTVRLQLAEIATGLESVPNSLLGIICGAIYPSVINAETLIQLLRKSEGVKRFGWGLPYQLKSQFETQLKPEQAGELLPKLIELAQTPPHTEQRVTGVPISLEFSWVGKLFSCVLQVLFRKPSLSPDDAQNAATALRMLGHVLTYGHLTSLDDETIKALDAATKRHPLVRRNYAWQRVARYRQTKQSEPIGFFQLVDYHQLLQFSAADFEWLLGDIARKPNSEDRELALKLAVECLRNFRLGWRNWRRTKRATKDDQRLRRLFRKEAAKQIWFRVRRFYDSRIQRNLGNRWWWTLRFQAVRGKWYRFKEQWILLTHLNAIASGKAILWLAHLIREADEKNSMMWAAESWNGLVKKRGRWIAKAARQGCKRFWREFVPQLPHEKASPNQTDLRVGVGLTGIQAEIADRAPAFPALSQDDAILAARYGVNELNGFPSWFGELAANYPTAVQSVLTQCISEEWQFQPERERMHEVMNKLVWQGKDLVSLIQDHVINLLRAGDPPSPKILEFALSIALNADESRMSFLAEIANQRLPTISAETRNFSLWIAVLLQLDAGRALPILENSLRNTSKPKDSIIRVSALLNPRRSDEKLLIAHPSYESAVHLRRLIPIVYAHVRPEDDVDRVSGEGYTPGPRDDAQEFRGDLIPRLAREKTSEAQTALRELLDEPLLAHAHDWIHHLLEQQAETAAESRSWTPADIREFAIEHEIDPKTDRDLYKIACKRLKELKNDVEKSDNSLRDELRAGDIESKLRRWVARKLQERSRKRFIISQEDVIDLEERPDLRIQNQKTNPVSVEVKWAERWTAPQLLDRLENQLLGQYLRAHTSRHAVYLIGLSERHEWRSPDEDRLLSFAELIELLINRANELCKQREDVEGVAVFGIDFRQPD
jgi:hypothetical protein